MSSWFVVHSLLIKINLFIIHGNCRRKSYPLRMGRMSQLLTLRSLFRAHRRIPLLATTFSVPTILFAIHDSPDTRCEQAVKWWRYGDSSPLSLSLVLRSPAALTIIRSAHFSCTAGVRVGFESPLVLRIVCIYEIRATSD